MNNLLKTWQDISVKNYEGSQILFYLQANKLACHSSVDDCRRHETCGLEMKDSLLLTEITVDRVSAFFHHFPAVQFPQGDTNNTCISSGLYYREMNTGANNTCIWSGLYYREMNPEFKEPKFLGGGGVVSMPAHCSRRRHCFYIERL